MGINVVGSKCSCSTNCETVLPKPRLPNPDPKNFKIRKYSKINDFIIMSVNYPDCTNYEGDKILVFYKVKIEDILEGDKIDPHFCKDCVSPIARFEPTKQGWEWALSFVDSQYEW